MITIVVMHLVQGLFGSNLLNSALSFGGAGVHLFILCSGFGLYLSHIRRPLGYGSFLQRRFRKVYIPYAVIVVISFVTPFYCASPDKLRWLLSHLLLYKMFFSEYIETLGVQLWFVSAIIQFYILWPVIVKSFELTGRWGKWYPFIIALVVSLAWATVVALTGNGDKRNWNSFFLQYLWEFVLGMYLARWYVRSDFKLPDVGWWLLLATIAVCVPLTYICGKAGGILKLYNDVPSLFGYTALATLVYKARILNRIVDFTSSFSYEWYLVHVYCFACVAYMMGFTDVHQMDSGQKYIYILVAFIVSYGAAYLYKPIIGWLERKVFPGG